MKKSFILALLCSLLSLSSFAVVGPIFGPPSGCVGSTVNLLDTSAGGLWSSSVPAVASIGATSGIVNCLSVGTTTISYVASGGTATMVFTVNPAPPPIGGPGTVCVGAFITLTNSVPGGFWNSSTTAVATVGSSSGIVSGISPGTATITYTLTSGCRSTRVVTVSAGPAVISGPINICLGQTAAYTDITSGGTWSSSNTAIATINSGGIATALSLGTVDFTYTVASGCYVVKHVTVNPLPAPVTGPNRLCVGSVATYTDATPGGTWTSTSPTIVGIDPVSGIANAFALGTTTIIYSSAAGCPAYLTVTVGTAPAITGPGTLCVGSTVTLSSPVFGGTWSSGTPWVADVDSSSGIVTGVSAGTASITYHVGACESVRIVTVNAAPAPIAGPDAVCLNGTITLTDATAGGTWTSSNSSIAMVNAAGAVTGIAPGVVTITYTLPTGCFAIKIISVNPPALISGPTSVCVGSSITLAATPGGGSWSSSTPGTATVGVTSGIVSGIAAGTATITYSIGGCHSTWTITVGMGGVISGSSTVCAGSSTSLIATPPGGIWTSSAPTMASVGSTGVVTGLTPGVVTISYTIGGCTATKIMTVTMAPGPIMGPDTLCQGATITLTNAVPGGSWLSSAPSVATVGITTGVVTGASVGTAQITYMVGGCIATKVLWVYPSPAAISGSSTICVGTTTTLTSSPTGGMWSSSNTSVATVNTAGVVTGISAGTAVITYTIASGCFVTKIVTVNAGAVISGSSTVCIGASIALVATPGGGVWSSSAPTMAFVGSTGVVTGMSVGVAVITYSVGGCMTTKTVTVTTSIATISGSSTVCVGASTTLSATPTGGVWTSSAPTMASVGSTGVVTGLGAGIVTISYTISGCTSTHIISVNPAPAAITGSSTLCAGSSITLSSATAGGTWLSSSTSVATVDAAGVVTGVAAGVVNIYYTVGGCSVSKTVTVSVGPSAITGSGAVCVGSSIALANATPGGTWSSSSTAIAIVGATGIVTGISAGSVTITYTVGACSVYKNINVATTAGIISGPSTVCAGATITLSSTVTGGVWSTGSASTATVGSSSGIVTGVSAGTVTIYYVVGGCATFKKITVTPGPGPITGSSTVCVGATTTLGTATPGGVWSSSTPTIATISTAGVVTGVAPGVVTITYTVGSCSVTKTMSVNTAPTLTGSNTVCVGGTITLTASVGGGTWTSSAPTKASVSSTGVVTGLSAGTTRITYATGGCMATMVISVNAAPSAIGGSSTVCTGSSITLTNTTPGGSWSSSNVAIAAVDSTGVVTGVSAGAVVITYAIGGCSVTKIVSVTPGPAAIAGGNIVCVGGTIVLTNGTPGGVWSSSSTAIATVNASGLVAGISPGVVTISYSLGGCVATRSVTVTATPTAIGGPSSVCVGGSITLTNSVSGGSWSSSNPSIATVSASGVVTGVATGGVIITYSVGPCFIMKTVAVTAGPAPIAGASTVCVGSNIVLSNSTPGGVWSSSSAAIATVGSTGVVTGVSAGVVTITYNVGGCSVTKLVTVTAVPAITGSSTLCVGSSIVLTASVSGGVWTSSVPAIATIGSGGVVTGVSTGTVLITYSAGGCFATKVITVTSGLAPITGSSIVCIGTSITMSHPTPGGTWSSSSVATATINAAGVVTGVSGGVVTITYSVAGCIATKSVTVNSLPPTITGSSTVCVGSTIVLSNTVPGGSWISGNPSIASVGSSGVVTGVAPGSVNIYYSVGGCSTFKTITVTTGPAPIVGSSTVCMGSSTTLTDATAGGTWSTSNLSVATISASGVVTGLSAGAVVITYTVGGCSVTKTMSVSAGPAPIGGGSLICVTGTLAMTDATPGGVWSSSNTAVATINPSGALLGVSAGVVTVSYTVGGCTATKSVTVAPTPVTITGPSTVCVGATITLVQAATGGSWSSSNTARATVSATGVVTGVSAGTVLITYSTGPCFIMKAVSVNPAPGPISGPTSVCTGGTITLTDAVPGGTWSSSNTTVAMIGITSGVVTGITAGTTNIFYSIAGCGSFKKSITVISCGGKSAGTISDVAEQAGSFNIFPNPTSGNLNITWENQVIGEASVVVTDVIGREVSRSTISSNNNSGEAQLTLSGLGEGVYVITIKSETVNYNSRIFIRH